MSLKTVAVVAAAATIAVFAASRAHGAPTRAEAATATVGRALPQATAEYVPNSGGGSDLVITVPSDDARVVSAAGAAKAPSDVYAMGELGWKAELAAAFLAASDTDIRTFRVTVSGASPTPEAQNYLHGPLRMKVGDPLGVPALPKAGTISTSAALAQLESNIDVLKDVLGGAFIASSTSSIEVNPSANSFGVEADITVVALASLNRHMGDVMDGLATGLVGNPDAVVEGLAVNIVDADGNRLSLWRNARDGSGLAKYDPALAPTGPTVVDAEFPNLTGGPPTLSSVSGGPSGPCSSCGSVRTGKPRLRAHASGHTVTMTVSLPSGVTGRVHLVATPNEGRRWTRWLRLAGGRQSVRAKMPKAASRVAISAYYPAQNHTTSGRTRRRLRLQ